MATMRKLAVGLIILAALVGCELAGERDPVSPPPEEPTLTAKPLCVKECAKANDSCIAEAARELLECVEDMSEPPICSDYTDVPCLVRASSKQLQCRGQPVHSRLLESITKSDC